MTKIKKMKLDSVSLVDDRLQALKQLLPEAFSESGVEIELRTV